MKRLRDERFGSFKSFFPEPLLFIYGNRWLNGAFINYTSDESLVAEPIMKLILSSYSKSPTLTTQIMMDINLTVKDKVTNLRAIKLDTAIKFLNKQKRYNLEMAVQIYQIHHTHPQFADKIRTLKRGMNMEQVKQHFD
ncbi:unnamed protein product [Caenorhabditis angaria]|uniref:Uncharacterized protein n=1 Tax=Caenorhabditis angaria TaxID=860376 RepID=A0A9P1IJZ9_9PELO|nr:unnamed protein product [Caenorhabditis angaria]